MTKLNAKHLNDAIIYAKNLIQHLPDTITYHCDAHTFEVVMPKAIELAKAENLNDHQINLIGIAAVFHDTGFLKQYNHNEPIGAKYAIDYIQKSRFEFSEKDTHIIKAMILNTDMQNSPKDIYQEIIRDADLSYFGSNNFLTWIERLRIESLNFRESNLHEIAKYKTGWISASQTFISNQTWFTKSAETLWEKQKRLNLSLLKNTANEI